MPRPSPQVIFYQVGTPKAKIERLCNTSLSHFEKKKPLLVLTDSEKTSLYIDELLWRYPLDSFLPHTRANGEIVRISHKIEKDFDGSALFNLTRSPLIQLKILVKTIYEFEDLTTPEKAKSFAPRYKAYSGAGCRIVSL